MYQLTPSPASLRHRRRMIRFKYMQAHAFDTNASVKKLEKSGFSRAQAEAVTEVLNEAASTSLATKTDLKDLELRLYKYFSAILIAHAVGTAALTVSLLQLLR